MSLNTILPASSPQLEVGESLLTQGHTADLELRVPATMAGPKRTEYAKGRLWVTDQRVIFLVSDSGPSSAPAPGYDAPPALQSLAIPYTLLLRTEFNLPLFSANNMLLAFMPDLASDTLPSPGRGASLEAKVVVGEGAAHAVWKRVEGERARVEDARRRGEEESLPVYEA